MTAQEMTVRASSTARLLEMNWAMKYTLQAVKEVRTKQLELWADRNFQFNLDDKDRTERFLEELEAITESIKKDL